MDKQITRDCRVCEVELNDDNWLSSCQKNGNYICKVCNREYGRAWREANQDEVRESNRSYREKNQEDEILRVRLYRKNNPEKAKAQSIKQHRKNGSLPMAENKECSAYLGVYTAERLLRHFFNDVEVMPYGNPGYDIVCNKGKKIDSKSCCIIKNKNGWSFHINHNTTADYFCCVAFDNRDDLNPLHMWLLPGDKFNHLTHTSISPSTLDKWAEYEQNIDDIVSCCNTIKGDHINE